MRGVLVGVVLAFSLLSVSANAQIAEIPNLGSYPKYGDDFLYLAEGGYAELGDSNVTDIDYTTTSFSVEAIADTKSLTLADWNGILTKGGSSILYNAGSAGWGIGFDRTVYQPLNAELHAKVGDGTQHVSISRTADGIFHAVMTWDHTTKTLELFVNGVPVGNKTDTNIVLANIDNTQDLTIGRSLGDIKRNILMVRWWTRKLSDQDVTALADNWLDNGDDRAPVTVSRNGLRSEWLMNKESAADGGPGTGHIKDSRGNNHLQMVGNVQLITSNKKPLTMVYPNDGETGIDKSVTLMADGGGSEIFGSELLADFNKDDCVDIFDLSFIASHFGKTDYNPEWNVTADVVINREIDIFDVVFVASRMMEYKRPLLYFFQVDTSETFDSPDLKESGWIPHYGEYRSFLDPGTTYYWRVKAKDTNGIESSYSETRSFTTEPASTWYVRPEGGDYGNEDGISYDNAWDGLLNVEFGENGVEPGDTLRVCGLNYYTVTQDGYIASQGGILVLNGRNYSDSTKRVTIDGNCPEGEPGIVWGAYRMFDEDWVYEGNNVYSIHFDGCSYRGNFFQDVGVPGNDDYILLNRTYSIEELEATPGSYYGGDGWCRGDKLYVHTTDNGDPTGRIWANRYGYGFKIRDNRYITFKNLKLLATGSGINSGYPSSYIRWENCTIKHWEHGLLDFWDGHNYMEIINNELAWASNGIYMISGTNNAPSNFLIKGNYIHDIGVLPYHQNGDAHCIGVQGGYNNIFEDNICEYAGTGITMYTFTNQEMKNNTVRRNVVKNTHTFGGANSRGIETACNNDALADKSGNKFYQNIVVNTSIAYRLHFEEEQELYNNIAYNCGIGFASGRNYNSIGAKVKFRNNIFLNNSLYHIHWYSGASQDYLIDSDYNIFYPAEGDMFRHAVAGGDMNFTEWQEHTHDNCPDCSFDTNSLAIDPLFVDPESGDFRLQPGSPAIDNGTFVGLTMDFEGNSIPQGSGTDIGVYEYNTG